MDILSPEERSKRMSLVRSRKNKSTELALINIFRALGIKGWRRNYIIRGKPDFVFRKRKIALFIDGCFWHGCSLHFRLPKTNKKFWSQKISCNIERDKRTNKELRKMGWKVVRIWEHDIKSDRLKKRLIKLLLHGNISSRVQ